MDASGATLKGEWPTISGLGTLTNGSVTATSKHADRNEMDVANENNYVQPGAVVTLTPTASSNYHVKDSLVVKDNNNNPVTVNAGSAQGTFTFTVPENITSLSLEDPFEADEEPGPGPATEYNITKGTMANGDVTVAAKAEAGASVILTPVPAEGYELTALSYTPENGSPQSISVPGDEYKFVMPAANVMINATFTAIDYTVTVDGGITGGTVSASPTTANKGDTITLTVEPAEGKKLGTLTVTKTGGSDTVSVSASAPYTFTMPASNVTVTATFVDDAGTTTPDDPTPPSPPSPPVVDDPTPVDPTPVEPSEPVVETNTAADGTVTTTTTWDDGKEAVAVKTPEGKTEITVTAPTGEAVAKVELPAEPTTAKTFEDVKTGAWYETAVSSATGYGLFNGTTETTFSPDTPMSRGMLATVLHNLSGKPTYGTGEGAFTDVGTGIYYEDPVDWAYKIGVTSGTGTNQFSPEQNITREQLVTMLYNYAKAIGAASKNRTGLTSFPDGGNVAGYAEDAMQWAVAEGFISGRANGGKNYIAPKGTATRAEVAVVLSKFVEYLK